MGLGELLWDHIGDEQRLGGAPANVVYHATVLGDRGVLLTRVGDDEPGRAAVARLSARGVDTTLVQRDQSRPTGTARVRTTGGEAGFVFNEGSAWTAPRWTPAWEEIVAGAHVLCFGTLLTAHPAGRVAVQRAAAAAAARGAIRLLDLNLRPPFDTTETIDAALACASVVKLSEEEAAELSRRFEVADAVGWLLRERGVDTVAVTRGARGSALYTRAGPHDHGGLDVDVGGGDPVGAGDAFTAALAHHLVRGSPPARISEAANRYAAHVASRAGAMPGIPAAVRAEVVAR